MGSDTTGQNGGKKAKFHKEKVGEWGTEGQRNEADDGVERRTRRTDKETGNVDEAVRENKGRGRGETIKRLDSAACTVYCYYEVRFMRV